MSTTVQRPSLGVLHLGEGEKRFRLSRYAPSAEVSFFVRHYWIVSWDLTDQEPYLQDVIPNPCVNLVIEKNKSGIYCPARKKFSYFLQGKGCVFGVKFKPGGFYPFLRQPISTFAQGEVSLGDAFDLDDETAERSIFALDDEGAMVEFAESFLRPKLPPRDESVVLINRIIEQIIEDREITKVDDLCERFDLNKRKLQRIFDQYVGVSPKWVIQLYRIQNAAESLDQEDRQPDWSQLSIDLGYYDQAHFIKDFKSIIGVTPVEYSRKKL
ncbi:DUF6597 domain-containing transcriptional factor [Tumebacillus lipolyticus]|uniref:DUF6597 domain-containing transcriptional factor n=1 Tax=Tumebacillus lipolyticus TaxID=1280370 RepID=A0ABW4ZYG6_9BACL